MMPRAGGVGMLVIAASLVVSCDRQDGGFAMLGSSPCIADSRYELANTYLGWAEELIAKEDYQRANIRLRDGLESLGTVPLGDDVMDHTGMRLAVASDNEWNGREQAAATLRQGVLRNRLVQYAEFHKLTNCRSPAESISKSAEPPVLERR
jgi:hypothetical protein